MEKYRTSEKNGHKEAGERVKVSLNVKIFIHLFVLLLAALGSFALLSVFNLGRYTGVIEEADRQRSEIIDKDITSKMQEVATYNLLEYVEAAARIIDREFWSMKHDIELPADSATGMLEYPEYYNPAEIDPPDPEGSGKLDSYVLYSPDADLTDEAMMSDLHLLANLCPMMESIASDKDAVRETIIALPGGASLLADSHPEEKTDENGDPVTFDATTRPFFIGSTLKHDTYFTHSDMDVFEDEMEVIVGVPVYVDSKLRAVCGGARHLSDLEDIIQSIDYSDESRICLVNDAGVMIYSQWDTGELYMGTNETDNLLDSPNQELADLVRTALEGRKGCDRVIIDGEPVYMAYAPLETLGWTLLMGISEKRLERPAKDLLAKNDQIESETLNKTRRMSRQARFIMVAIAAVLMVISAVLSLRVSKRLVKPLIQLKQAGIRFIEQDDSSLDEDSNFFGELELNTGDEIEDLWMTMKELESNIASSVRNLERVTAEKERIDTELSVATKIQSDMLPGVFPAFPDRSEFDLYSTMNPAKEVGGDFYDFYLTDDDHLALVMADVSGKGVPAALFMVIAKTLIKNAALSGRFKGPGEILASVNNELCRNNTEEMFVTVWLGIVDISNGHIVSASGGHEYPMLCRKGGSYELIKDIHGPGLATFEDIDYDEWEGELYPGDHLFLYTDGVPEATDASGELFGMDRMTDALNVSRSEESLQDKLLSVKRAVDAFVGDAPQFDDITMTIFEYKGDRA